MKKIWKKTMKILGILILILVMFSISVGIFNRNFIKSKKEYTDYLKKNKTDISSLQKIGNIDLNIEKADFYLLGENHGVKDVQELDEQFLFYLNKKYGVTYYVAEMSEKLAAQLNKYLSNEKEDPSLLKKTVSELAEYIPQQSSIEYYEKWRNIRNYNLSQNEGAKIKVIGVDVPNPEITNGRDSILYHNFTKVYDTIKNKENARFYGLFGHAHILQDRLSGDTRPFAYRLKEKKLKVISIATYAIDSYTYLPDGEDYPKVPNEKSNWFNLNGPLFYLYGVNDLIQSSESERVALFKLDNANSPYASDTKLINIRNLLGKNIKPYSTDENTLNFIQYAVLIKKSESLTPLKRLP